MENKFIRQFVEFLLVNSFWYVLFSFIYFDPNPLNWWLLKNMWGRLIIFVLEASIIRNIKKEELDLEKNEEENN
jgi:hypothetical protein